MGGSIGLYSYGSPAHIKTVAASLVSRYGVPIERAPSIARELIFRGGKVTFSDKTT